MIPTVSVLLLTYENLNDIYPTLDSVFKQDYSNMELIISDDGSKDYSHYRYDILKYIEMNKGTNIREVKENFNKENIGTVRNANSALTLASGEYIRFISPGDELLNGSISKMVEFAQKNHALIVCARTYVIYNEDFGLVKVQPFIRRIKSVLRKTNPLIPTAKDIKFLNSISDEKQRSILSSRCIISTPAVLYKKRLFDDCGGYPDDYRILEDMPYWPHISKQGVRFYFLNEPVVKYSLNGISNNNNATFKEEYVKAMKEIYIPNDNRFGIFAIINRKLRSRYTDYIVQKKCRKKILFMLQYLDCFIFNCFKQLKFVLFNTKL